MQGRASAGLTSGAEPSPVCGDRGLLLPAVSGTLWAGLGQLRVPLARVAPRFHWLAGEAGGGASTSRGVCKICESGVLLLDRTQLAGIRMSCNLDAARSLEQLEARGGRLVLREWAT